MDRQHLTRALVRRNAYRGLFCRQLTQLPVAVLAHYSTVTIGQPPVSQPAHAAAAACQSCCMVSGSNRLRGKIFPRFAV